MKEEENQCKLNEESKEVVHEASNDGCLFNEIENNSLTAGIALNEETGTINPH